MRRLPAGPAPAPQPTTTDEREIPIAPLPAADAGREEARAAFIRDAGGAPPETPAPADPTTAEQPKPAAAVEKSSEQPQPEVTVEGVTTMAVAMIDGLATMLGPRFVGGSPSTWAQTEKESKNLITTATPIVSKMMSETNITPEALFLGTLAFIYVPRAFAGAMERASEKRAKKETRDAGAVGPTGAAAAPAPEAAPPAAPPPPPAPAAPPPTAPPAAGATTINLGDWLRLK